MFGFPTGVRVLVATALAGLVLAGCSGGEPPAPPPPPPPAAVPAPPPPPAPPRPGAVSVAQAAADPTKRFVLSAGDPARCLESQGGKRAGGVTVLDGRAVLDRCRPTEGQVWSFRAEPDGTYRVSNRPGVTGLCFEGAPKVATDGAANTTCDRSPGQVWRVEPTSGGFLRLRTDAAGPRCLGVAPVAPVVAPAAAPGVAMVPCEPAQHPPGAPRTTQDWELRPAPPLPAPPPPTSTPRPKPKPAPTTPKAPSGPTGQVLSEVNSARSAAGCGAVRRDPRLDRAAEEQAQYMSESGQMGHSGAGGSSPQDRIEGAGWDGGSSGENVAEGQDSAAEVMTDWMNSEGHRRNIEDCEFSSIGLARVGDMWVQTFGG